MALPDGNPQTPLDYQPQTRKRPRWRTILQLFCILVVAFAIVRWADPHLPPIYARGQSACTLCGRMHTWHRVFFGLISWNDDNGAFQSPLQEWIAVNEGPHTHTWRVECCQLYGMTGRRLGMNPMTPYYLMCHQNLSHLLASGNASDDEIRTYRALCKIGQWEQAWANICDRTARGPATQPDSPSLMKREN